jgi:dGTPase
MGYSILNTLLQKYTAALVRDMKGQGTNYDKLLLKGLKAEHDYANMDLYERLLLACSYVASLTDGNAHNQFKKMTGNGSF